MSLFRLLCALATAILCLVPHSLLARSSAWTDHTGLTLATWNMDWLMTPRVHDELARHCVRRQPGSDQRAIPCSPDHPPPPARTDTDLEALARAAEQLRQADVVALQEVDGTEAARQVFRTGWQLDCFVQRLHPQKVGFAIRSGIPYRCNGDLGTLDVDGHTRAGADVTLYPGTAREVRLLAVHLKSGCFDGRLDRHFSPCERLRQQVPVVAQWIDARTREGVPFAVLGDFNRHLDHDARRDAGPDALAPQAVFQRWREPSPAGPLMLRATQDQPYVPCDGGDHHKAYIDDILIDQKLAAMFGRRTFARPTFSPMDAGRLLSDHCPVVWQLQP